MADLRVAFRFTSDTAGLVGGVRVAREEIGGLTTAAQQGAAGMDRLAGTAGGVRGLRGEAAAATESLRGLGGAAGLASAAFGALSGALGVRQLVEYADQWKSVESRLRLVTSSSAELRTVQDALFQTAQRTRQSFEATADTYGRFARATQGLGASGTELLQVVETINKAVAISGGPAASAEAALFQLGQAMSAGALRGDELNSVLDQTPRLAEAIAAGMGKTTGELRTLAEQGKLTSEAVFKSLLSQSGTLSREFDQIAPTVSSSVTQLRNAVVKYAGETDTALGVTDKLARGIKGLAENLPEATSAALGLGIAFAGMKAGQSFGPWATGAIQAAEASATASGSAKVLAAETLAAAQAAQIKARADLAARAAQLEASVALDGAIGRTQRIVVAEQALAAARAERAAADAAVLAAETRYAATLTGTGLAARAASAAQTLWNGTLAFLGGPIGAGIAITAGVIAVLATRTTDAQRAQEAYNVVLGDGRKRIDELRGASAQRAAQLVAEQREAVQAVEREVAAIRLRIEMMKAEAVANEDLQRSSGLPGITEGSRQALTATNKELAEAERRLAAAQAALEGMQSKVGSGDASWAEWVATIGRGSKSLSVLTAALQEVDQATGYTVEKGVLLTKEQAELSAKTAVLNAIMDAGVGAMAKYGRTGAAAAQQLEVLRLKLDPVRAAVAELNAETNLMRIPEGFERDFARLLAKVTDNGQKALGAEQIADLRRSLSDNAAAQAGDQTAKLEREAAGQRLLAGALTDAARAHAQNRIALSEAAAKLPDLSSETVKAIVTSRDFGGVLKGLPPDLQKMWSAMQAGSSAQLAGPINQATDAMSRQARQALELAAATRQGGAAVAEVELKHQIENETYKIGAGVRSQLAQRIREEFQARKELAAAQFDRDMELQIAAAKALALAEGLGAKAISEATVANQVAAQVEKEGIAADSDRAKAIKAKTEELAKWQERQGLNRASAQADDDVRLLQLELSLQGEGETIRTRTLELAKAELELRRQFPRATDDEIEALLRKHDTAIQLRQDIQQQRGLWDEIGRLGERAFDRVGSAITEAFAQGKTSAISWGSVARAVMSEVIQAALQLAVINPLKNWVTGGNAPSIWSAFGGGQSGQQTQGGGLSSLTNMAVSKAGSYALDKIVPGGLSATIDQFGYSTLGIGTAVNPAPLMATGGANGVGSGMLVGGGAQSQLPTISGGLSGYLGAAGAGAFGGMIGGMIGTATNSKAVGGISGAALGAGASYMASIMGMSALGGPIGLAIGAIVGAVVGLLGTQKKSVGPNSSAELRYSRSGVEARDFLADNGADPAGIQAVTEGVAKSVNTIVSGIGARWTAGSDPQNLAAVKWFQKDNKWYVEPRDGSGGRQEYGSQEEAIAGLIKWSLQRLDQTGAVADVSPDVRTALKNTKATKAEDLANDLDFAANFRSTFNAMNSDMDPVSNQIKEFTDQAKKLGEQVKTNLLDWRDKARDLGLATEGELTVALKKGMMAMLGLGPTVEPLRGVAAITEQAKINFESIKPALGSLGYTAAEQADILNRYVEKAKKDYLDQVGFIQRQGALSIRSLTDPSAAFSMTDRWKAIGLKGDEKALIGLTTAFQAIDAAATGGTLAMTSVTSALASLDTQLQDGVLTAEQYGQAVGWLTSAWQRSAQVAVSLRQGQRAIDTAIDPTRGRDAGSVFDDAGISSAASGIADFRTQLDAFLRTAKAGSLSAADLTYTHAQLAGLLSSGAITAQQYQTVVQALTGAYTDATAAATANADAIRRGAAGIAALIDPTRQSNASDLLTGAGITATGSAVSMFRTQLDGFLVSARAGTASTADLTVTYGQLERLLKAGTITADQYQTVLEGITTAWQAGKETGQQWTQVATKAAQEVGQAWQTAANTARQAAADWTRVSDGMSRALDSLIVNKDLSNLGADAMLSATEQQFQAAAQTLMDYQNALQAGQTPSDEARKAAVDAAERLDGLGQRYLEEARAYGLGAEEYNRRLTQVQTLYGTVRDMARSLSSAETLRAQGYDRQIAWLDTINDTLSGTSADQKALLQGIKDELIAGRTPANPTSPTTSSTGAYSAFSSQLSAMQRGLSAADAANGGRLGYADYNAIRGQYLYAERDALSTATAAELSKAYEAAKGVSALTTQIVIDQMKAKGMTVSWADQFRNMFAAYWENSTAIDQRAGSKESARANLEYWVGVRDQLAQAIPTSELLALLGKGAEIEPRNPDTWDLRVKYWLHERGVPGFAAGGLHAGGARVVGERGAELEVTGPARYWTHDQTRDILSPKSVSVSVDMAPVVVAVGGVTSAVMDIGRLIGELSRRVANVEEAIADLSRSHGQLAVQIRKVASR